MTVFVWQVSNIAGVPMCVLLYHVHSLQQCATSISNGGCGIGTMATHQGPSTNLHKVYRIHQKNYIAQDVGFARRTPTPPSLHPSLLPTPPRTPNPLPLPPLQHVIAFYPPTFVMSKPCRA